MLKRRFRAKEKFPVLTRRGDRHNQFRLQRIKNDHGFYVYVLENTAENRKIFIPRFVFGQFRACVQTLLKDEISKDTPEPFERSVVFLNQTYFYFRSSRMDLNNLIIQDLEERKGSSGYVTVSRRYLNTLSKLLYSENLQHPNDVLEGIISYHKLFQFSFVKGSKSITSDLVLRKDVLQSIDDYRPSLAARASQNDDDNKSNNSNEPLVSNGSSKGEAKSEIGNYQPKLGERSHDKDIKVDYGQIFGDKKVSLSATSISDDKKEGKSSSKALTQFPTPLSALEIKAYGSGRFQFELNAEESLEFRSRFISDRASEFYLGLEIVDTLFLFNKTLKSFQFPLYYLKVHIRESGRSVRIEARDDGRIYLNHLALAHLVDKFSEKTAGVDLLETFFNTLLAQFISVDQLNDRITLIRHLPVADEIFDRTREILFGYQDDNGKGGILGDLKFKGIECDLHNVILYRAPKLLSPNEQSLEHDLDKIQDIAHRSVKRFYSSLLGRFLTPELQEDETKSAPKEPDIWVPGRLPRSTRNLFDKLHHHDLVLLEGPPGTGKTFTILNLLIDSICNKKRILIVSDQQAAIEALIEKIQEYLYAGELDNAAMRNKNELLFGAIKVIDTLPDVDKDLSQVVDSLTKTFKVVDQGILPGKKRLDKRLALINQKINALTGKISATMASHMAEDVSFDLREPFKNDSKTDIAGLIAFLHLLVGKQAEHRPLIDAFVNNRLTVINGNMDTCYSYFKIPVKHSEDDIANLRRDEAILAKIVALEAPNQATFQELIKDVPYNEIIRYLETTLVQHLERPETGLKKVARKIRPAMRTDLQKTAAKLHSMMQDQISLLQQFDTWPAGVWDILRDIHETIRVGDKPSRTLSLYKRIEQIGASRTLLQRSSIQSDLEQIDDLIQQRDKVVYECFVDSLHDITQSATQARRGAGTNAITRVLALAENLKQFDTIDDSGTVFEEFRQALYETFPVWIARKQAVALMLPCTEQSFDLVIIDEATQCRVDDALSLMFRAKKILVVGDDKQTVLQKDSSIDDYLFKDHELDEHLRSTQAHGFKGGGSNIFALVKSIKQASVMLDEHYRCPADIIAYSNKYVYDNELKVMQWNLPEQPSPVVVDDSEKDVKPGKKPSSGKFKGIETAMLDRFFDYVRKTIIRIEKESGRRINVEADVALCYFLLKNEPYVQHVKAKFLSQLNRGENILDGAGAALQGKERDYIFYFWDITRYNLSAFTQGDDESKRKGELNVLMSRPKKMAFHFLHHTFAQLDHGRSNISQYLWRTLVDQQRETNGGAESAVASLSLFEQLLEFTVANSKQRGLMNLRHQLDEQLLDFRQNIVVGDARKSVDLVAFPKQGTTNVVGMIDLAGFQATSDTGMDIVDYYFQLKRAKPAIVPVFMFAYEMVDENSSTFRALLDKLEHTR